MSGWIGIASVLLVAVAACSATTPDGPQTGAETTEVSRVSAGDIAHLVGLRLTPGTGPENGWDQLVLEFADRVPGYTVSYQPLPARADASGFEIPLPGASELVQITLNPATGDGWAGGQRTYFGPSAVQADTAVVTEVKAAGDFEATLTWVAGLRSKVPFRVRELQGPPRLEVDFQQVPAGGSGATRG